MKIQKIKKMGTRYKIYLDDNTVINTFDEIIIKYNLLFKKELDINMISKIHLENDYYDNYDKALKLIDKRIRSSYEVEKYLIKNGVEDYQKIIEELKSKGFLDDEKFAKAFISDKLYLSNDGKGKIKKELLKHNIDESVIDRELSFIKEDDMERKIDKIISKKIMTNKKDSPYILKQKIMNYLINLGYNQTSIISRMELFDFSNDNYAKEMDKIYKKLSIKYEGDILLNKFKQKLYTKGFSIDEINDYIQKSSSFH